jgi:hypothetical protein
MQVHFQQNPVNIPVLIPDSRESDQESGSLRTASTAIALQNPYATANFQAFPQ